MARLPVLEVELEPLDGAWQTHGPDQFGSAPPGAGRRSTVTLLVAAAVTVGALAVLGSGTSTAPVDEDAAGEEAALVADPVPSTTIAEDGSTPAPRPERRNRDRRTVILPDIGGSGVVMLFGNEAFQIDVDQARGSVTSLAVDDGGVYVTQGSGATTRFSQREPSGRDFGSANAVYPANQGVWLVAPGLVGQVVRHVVGDKELPAAVLPDGLSVAGSVGNSLLVMDQTGQWNTWNPVTGERTFAWVDGRVLTTAYDMVATDVKGDLLLGRPSTSARWRLPLYDVQIGSARFSANALWVAVATSPVDTAAPALAPPGDVVHVWHWAKGTHLTIATESVADLAVTDDGQLTVLTSTGELHVYDDTGRLVRQFIRPPQA